MIRTVSRINRRIVVSSSNVANFSRVLYLNFQMTLINNIMRKLIRINKPIFGREEMRNVLQVLKSDILSGAGGYYVSQFEKKFSDYVGTKYAVGMCNGTAALHAALMTAGVGRGDEVIVPTFCFVAIAEAVILCGAKPVFADCDPLTYCTTAENIESCITRKTKAVIVAHMFGLPCDMDPIREICKKYDLVLIEDASHAHGAAYKGTKVGNLADMACFSFYATKIITTGGEGGIVTTNNPEYAEKLHLIRSHGIARGISKTLGHNYKMMEIQAAIGLAQLDRLDKFVELRRNNAKYLTREFEELSGKIYMPIEPDGFRHSWYVYTVRLKRGASKKRDKLIERLLRAGIEAAVYYRYPIHKMPYYKNFVYTGQTLPNSEKISQQVLSLPVHPGLRERDLERITSSFKKALASI